MISALSLKILAVYSSWVCLLLCVVELSGVLLLVWDLSRFFMKVLSAMNLSLSTAFIVFHKFRYVVPSFSLNTRKSLISLFPP